MTDSAEIDRHRGARLSRRCLGRTVLAGALLLPLVACTDRLPGSEGDPTTARKRCLDTLRDLGQLHSKPGGRCD